MNPTAAAFDALLAEAIAAPIPTVVHLWAPWCPDCLSELTPEGWPAFIPNHPGARFLFITVWSSEDGAGVIRESGLSLSGALTLLHHPNRARAKSERVGEMLGRPIRWIPATWVYRSGRILGAFDEGTTPYPQLEALLGS